MLLIFRSLDKNPTHAVSSMNSCLGYMNDCFEKAIDYNLIKFNPFKDKKINEKRCIQEVKDKETFLSVLI